jgi:hypothetical protein
MQLNISPIITPIFSPSPPHMAQQLPDRHALLIIAKCYYYHTVTKLDFTRRVFQKYSDIKFLFIKYNYVPTNTLKSNYNVRILLGTLIHVSAPCGAILRELHVPG